MIPPFGIDDTGAPGNGFMDTMDLVRKTWTAFALPPGMAPTMDPDEIARRVAELKTIEQWLVMNLTMLRSTIQALEIQQSTLAALRAFGMPGTTGASASGTEPASPMPDALNPVAWWELLQKQFGEVAATALAGLPTTPGDGNAARKRAPRRAAATGKAASTGKPAQKAGRTKAATGSRTRAARG